MWVADLASYGSSPRIVAVGRLARGHGYARGDIAVDIYSYRKLRELLIDPWPPQPLLACTRAIFGRTSRKRPAATISTFQAGSGCTSLQS